MQARDAISRVPLPRASIATSTLKIQQSSRSTGRIRVFLIDDQSLIRAALASVLETDPALELVGSAGDLHEAVERILLLLPDVVILDLALPGLSELGAIQRIRDASPSARVLVLTSNSGDACGDGALRAGADGFLCKDADLEELELAIRTVHRSAADSALAEDPDHRQGASAEPDGIHSLTPRERQVLQLLAMGKSNKECAVILDTCHGTIRKHRENLQRKLDCHSAARLAVLALREGLVALE